MAYIPPHLRKKPSDTRNENETVSASISPPESPPAVHHTYPKSYGRSDLKHKLTNGPLYTRTEIHKYYWSDSIISNAPVSNWSGTLSSSESKPDSLQYVILYHDANPRWENDKIIFVKTNLRLLGLDPSAFGRRKNSMDADGKEDDNSTAKNKEIDVQEEQLGQVVESESFEMVRELESSNETAMSPDVPARDHGSPGITPIARNPPTQPIAIFEQLHRGPRAIHFIGYHRITKLNHLAPKSEALARLLMQKWQGTQQAHPTGGSFWVKRPLQPKERDAARWAESLSVPWAVVKFEKLSQAVSRQEKLVTPDIQVHKDEHFGGDDSKRGEKGEDREGRSVNEMLKKLRMGGNEGEREPGEM